MRGVGIRGGIEIANIGQAFGAQQFLGFVLDARPNTGITHHADRGHLRRALCKYRRRADEASGAGERGRCQKAA